MSSDLRYLQDFLERIDRIRELTSDKDKFDQSWVVQDALLYNIAIIGEAARRLSAEIRVNAPHIQWHAIIGLRNIVIHDYRGVRMSEIWAIAQKQVPLLKQDIDALVRLEFGERE